MNCVNIYDEQRVLCTHTHLLVMGMKIVKVCFVVLKIVFITGAGYLANKLDPYHIIIVKTVLV